MQTFVAKFAVVLAAFSVGAFLRSTGLFNKQDARAAQLALTYGTLPSLVLQTLLTYGFLSWEGAAIGAGAVLVNLVVATTAWLTFRSRRRPERALLTGSAVGVALGSVAYAFVDAAFGPLGLHFAVLWDLGNLLSVAVLSYAILARGGPQTPARYVHADGGVYRGQWQGPKKHGLGVYTYPGGARYEGRWADNMKDGLGVYYFPKGGWYEGEWRKGERRGIGLRVMSSGAVQAGRWQGTTAVETMEPDACGFAASSARETAKAAQRVAVGGGSAADIALQLLKQPVFWAALVAFCSIVTSYQIPVMVDMLTAHLATAHIPLALLVLGVSMDLDLPKGQQVAEVAQNLALRFLLPLGLAAAAAFTLSSRYTDAIAVAALCAMGPMSEQVPYFVQLFRLNTAIASRVQASVRLASFTVLATLTFVMVLATPADALISRSGLAIALAVAAVAVTTAGSVAAWMLSDMKPGLQLRPAALSTATKAPASSTAASAGAGVQSGASRDIPIGIAWQEKRMAEAMGSSPSTGNVEALQGEEAEDADMQIIVRDEETGTPVELGTTDTGKGRAVGEASIVSGWDEAGNVLVGSQEESAVPETTGDKLELGEETFDMGGRFPDLGSAMQSEPGPPTDDSASASSQQQQSSSVRKGRSRGGRAPPRRQTSGTFQDAEDETELGGDGSCHDCYGLQPMSGDSAAGFPPLKRKPGSVDCRAVGQRPRVRKRLVRLVPRQQQQIVAFPFGRLQVRLLR